MLSDVFEAFVEADEPMKRSIRFGVFDASGTMVDRLLARLPKATVLPEPTAPQASMPTPVEPAADGSDTASL